MTQRAFSWMNPKLESSATSISGRGLFAVESLRKGERLIVSGGHVMTLDQERTLPDEISDYGHQIDDDLVLGVVCNDEAEDSERINHNCEPNSGFDGQIMLVAMRDIAAGEEITFDYAMVLSDQASPDTPYRMECLCGSLHCRGVVTGSDWKIPELQARYGGYFQPYLQKKIDKLKGNRQ